jgi:5,10-methylene-tetrahydrofolate dehydrogenase/methenyl tetrahydrofolate cyclohydrolase
MLPVVGAITPAIGGVGPVTVATLLRATVELALTYRKGRRAAKN